MVALYSTTAASGTDLGTATVTAADDTLTFGANHGMADGEIVITSAPAGGAVGILVPGVPYYVANSTLTTMQLRPAPGAPIMLFASNGTVVVDRAEAVYAPEGLRQAMGGLLYKARTNSTSGRFGSRPGVFGNTASSEVTISAFTVTVGNLNVVLNYISPTQNGPYICAISSTNLTVTAAAAQPRIDIVAARIRDTAVDGSGFALADCYMIDGTPAALPSAPAVPDGSFRLAQVSVPALGGGNPTLTYDADYTVAAGGILPVRNSSSYPTEVRKEGMYLDDASTDTLYRYNGSAWVPVANATSFGATRRLATTVRTSNTSSFTAETVIDTVVATLVNGATYRVTWYVDGASTAVNDRIRFRIREDNLAGTQRALMHVTTDAATVDFPARLECEYTAVADGAKTFVGTAIRQAGTGTIACNANANESHYLYVDYIRG